MTDKLKDLVKFDYTNTLSFLDKTDGTLFTIKNWAVTTNGAIFALAITSKNKYIFIINFVLISCFWLLELFYKCFHEDALRKSCLLEKLLSTDPSEEEVGKRYTFGLWDTIKLPHIKTIFWIIRFRLHMTFLYVVLLLLSTAGILFSSKLGFQ
ncbi:hypothetical protein ACFL5X_03215 [Candidatus Omnitrophota bacterium]